MNHPRTFIFLSVVGLLIAAAIVLSKKVPQDEMQLLFSKGVFPQSLMPKRVEPAAPRTGPHSVDEKLEPVVVDQKIESWDEVLQITGSIPRIAEIPWERAEIEKAIRANSGGKCRLLPPGAEVVPLPTVLGTSENPITSFRQTAFVVGLKMDPVARRTLPSLSKSSIEDYLSQHTLAVQASVIRAESGNSTFAGAVQAAFISRSSPTTTAVPESMIGEAIGNIHILGALPNSDDPEDQTARTIILAFAYSRDLLSQATNTLSTMPDYELLFMHLVKDDMADEPVIATFATTDGRATFQEIDPVNNSSMLTNPDVVASIRFEEFKMMGLYPADPVVTGVKNRVRFSTPTEKIRQQLRGSGATPGVPLQKLLDELHEGTVLARSPTR
ncbi:hypothetical protein [Planctomicrobium piriforme]|uniref:Uncharacterized protein n=1 Tax=Planctomicrobium piriforme TaxID=1576369 RepID=A0A1I3DD38_9PLAN|nr:hypothetical protein [Planctomicrobium piriforme]SFH84682.1 hypothetical protein SAMN05421753_103189 [Planctomicrobium piriforme]